MLGASYEKVSAAAELPPLWAPGEAHVGKGSLARSGSKPSGPARDPSLKLALKEYATWPSRVTSKLVFFSLLLGVGAILGVFTTMNAVRHTSNPEVNWLSSVNPYAMAGPPAENPLSVPSMPSGPDLMPYPVDLSSLSDAYHDMSDAELLWRASADSARRPRPDAIAPKVAYLFLTRGPIPLELLWERYFEGHDDLYSVYVHAHPNFLPNFRPDSVFFRRNVPSQAVLWGTLSVAAAERRLLANALLDAANERFVLVSESCIPITPFPVAYKYFLESNHSFVDAFIDLGPAGIGRYYRIRVPNRLKPEITPQQWRKGSQWFEMARDLALVVVSDTKYYAKYETVMCPNDCWCYADEHYLPTVLTILAPSKLANRTTTYVNFQGASDGHPFQWEPADVTEPALQQITSGHNCTYNGAATETCHLFARKFGPDTIGPLLELASSSFGIP